MWMRCKALQEAMDGILSTGRVGVGAVQVREEVPPSCLCPGGNQFRDQYCEFSMSVVPGSGLVIHARGGRDPWRYYRAVRGLWDPRDYSLWVG